MPQFHKPISMAARPTALAPESKPISKAARPISVAAGLLLLSGVAVAQTPAPTASHAESAPRVATAPGVTRARTPAPDTTAEPAPVDSSKPETARDTTANTPETARDDQKMTPETARDEQTMTPETATDEVPAADAKKAAKASKQGVRSNTPPPKSP